jgi:hypothetical protein
MVEIGINGDVRMCGCGDWMPSIVGNILEDKLSDILASHAARLIRQSIIDGDYKFCNHRTCGILLNQGLNTKDNLPPNVARLIEDSTQWAMPYEISVAGDLTCNLSCPSCRREVIKLDDAVRKKQEELGNRLADNIFDQDTDQTINLIVSNSGEVFASPMLLQMINKIDLVRFPNVYLSLQTNGLLAPDKWHRLGYMKHRVKKTTMTLDAARASTYEIVRRGGKWEQALRALKFLQTQKNTSDMKLHLRMVVQNQNWAEVLEFYDLAKFYGCDQVEYVSLANWGTWTESEFKQQDVFYHLHPDRPQAVEIMRQVRQLPDVFVAGDFG